MDGTRRKKLIYIILSLMVLAGSIALLLSVYRPALRKLIESCKDFGLSFAYLIACCADVLFDKWFVIPVTVKQAPSFEPYIEYIGIDISKIIDFCSSYLDNFFDILNFLEFNSRFLKGSVKFMLYFSMLFPLGYIGITTFKDSFHTEKPDSLGEKSQPYLLFVRFCVCIKLCIGEICAYVRYFLSKWYYKIPFVIIWISSFGLACIVFDFFAFYFYFLIKLDVILVLHFLKRALLDILIVCKGVPLWLALIVFCLCYHVYHRNKALDALRHNEAKNCGLIKLLEYTILIIGETGKGKTTLMTDIILSLVNIYKADSLKTLYKMELYFPSFDFSSYRAFLSSKIASHELFCIPDAEKYANEFYEAHSENLSEYEKQLFKESVNLGNRTLELKAALATYGKAFMIYQNNNLSVSNYSIRFDGKFDDSPFLKLWDGDFFGARGESRYSHILDSDIMRFGKKVDPDGKFNGSFGYGIWSRTEAAKSYGNQISNSKYDRKSEEANPLNDLVEYSLKMGRHPNSTVDNKVYFRMLMDEQRPTDLTGTIRELCSILSIKEKGELQLAITGYNWLFKLRDKLSAFENFYLKYDNARADFILAFMIPKLCVSFVNLCCERLENIYGYREIKLAKEVGTSYSNNGVAQETEELTWYQANMKVFAERFATDCYSNFFTELQRSCGYGIEDYPTYDSLYPTREQYELQKDFFIMDMMGKVYGEDTELKEIRLNHHKSAREVFADLVCED